MKFTVPASVTISGWIEVEAANLAEAKVKAEKFNDDGIDTDCLNDPDFCSVVHADETAPRGGDGEEVSPCSEHIHVSDPNCAACKGERS